MSTETAENFENFELKAPKMTEIFNTEYPSNILKISIPTAAQNIENVYLELGIY